MGFFSAFQECPKTAIHMKFQDGTHRVFVYPRILQNKEAHDMLDHLLDEMFGMAFQGPIEIYRQIPGGRKMIEIVGLLPVED